MRELRSPLWVLALSPLLGTTVWATPGHRTLVVEEVASQGQAAAPAVPAAVATTLPAGWSGPPAARALPRASHVPAFRPTVVHGAEPTSAPTAPSTAHGLLGLGATPATAPPRP